MSLQYGEVVSNDAIAPRMRRIVFGGPGLAAFEPSPRTDAYVNCLFPPDGAPYRVPFTEAEIRGVAADFRPRGRRYSVRAVDPAAGQITIDFVVHGDVGLAGRWALHAKPGDLLQMAGPSGSYSPPADADWHLMVGDESALPAIAASLEQVTSGTPAVVVAVVDDADGELTLDGPGDLRLHWVHRDSVGHSNGSCAEALVDVLSAIEWPAGTPDVFVHGEAEEVRSVRRYLVAERGVDREGASISPYWRRGQSDEDWRAVKREWIAHMESER